MEISTRGRYALRAMLDLAMHGGTRPMLRHDIAARQEISAEYAAQLFRMLRSAGLVRAVKGPGGGYALARDASQIRVSDVLRAVEGPLRVVYCVDPRGYVRCPRSEGCVVRQLWKELSDVITRFLDSITLQDLCLRAQAMERGTLADLVPFENVLLCGDYVI